MFRLILGISLTLAIKKKILDSLLLECFTRRTIETLSDISSHQVHCESPVVYSYTAIRTIYSNNMSATIAFETTLWSVSLYKCFLFNCPQVISEVCPLFSKPPCTRYLTKSLVTFHTQQWRRANLGHPWDTLETLSIWLCTERRQWHLGLNVRHSWDTFKTLLSHSQVSCASNACFWYRNLDWLETADSSGLCEYLTTYAQPQIHTGRATT